MNIKFQGQAGLIDPKPLYRISKGLLEGKANFMDNYCELPMKKTPEAIREFLERQAPVRCRLIAENIFLGKKLTKLQLKMLDLL